MAMRSAKAKAITAGVLVLTAVLLMVALRGLDLPAGGVAEAAWIAVFLAVPSTLVWSAFVVVASAIRPERAVLHASLAYALLGLLLVGTGVWGYIQPGYLLLLAFWPPYVIWLHPCGLGAGLWPCPLG